MRSDPGTGSEGQDCVSKDKRLHERGLSHTASLTFKASFVEKPTRNGSHTTHNPIYSWENQQTKPQQKDKPTKHTTGHFNALVSKNKQA